MEGNAAPLPVDTCLPCPVLESGFSYMRTIMASVPNAITRLSWLTSEFFISQTWLSMGYIIDRSVISVIPTVFHNQKSAEKALKRLLCPQFL